MWLTTSKNADDGEKQLAEKLATVLPGCQYAARGERNLNSMGRLAQIAGCTNLLVIGRSSRYPGKLSMHSRKYIVDKDAQAWAWNERCMEKLSVKAQAVNWSHSALEFENDQSGKSNELASFFGYAERKVKTSYGQTTKVGIESKKGGAKIIIGDRAALDFDFIWKSMDGCEFE